MIARLVTPRRFDRGIAIAAAAAIFVLGLLIVGFSEAAYRDQKRRDLDIQARIASESVAAALMFDDDRAAQDYVDALSTNPQIDQVLIHDADGRLAASFSRTPRAAAPAGQAHAAVFEAGAVRAASAVQRAGQSYGVVSVVMAPDPLAIRIGRYAPLVLLFTMAALVLLVAGAAQGLLARANTELETRARVLAETNARLEAEVEQRKEAEEALVQSRKMEAIGQLTGGVAHDFNNLLMIIAGGLRMMDGKDETRRARMLDAMRQAVDRGATLTRQLLAFSRRQPMRIERVDVHRQIEGMREILERSIRADILLEIDIPDGLPAIQTDPGLLELAIINLAVNARDAMPQGGVLTVGARRASDEQRVEITVTDTGSGIAPEILHRIFEPYFTTKSLGKGTGLGLSQVYGFARQSGGDARIISEVGVGTRVVLSLPVATTSVVANAARVTGDSSIPDASLRILVVEDDDGVAQTVEAMLNDLGHRPTRTASAQAALDLLDTDPAFDLVFSDIVMPGGFNGIELAQRLAKDRPKLPVLLTTGYSGQEEVDPDWALLRKPYQMQDLNKAIAKVAAGALSGP